VLVWREGWRARSQAQSPGEVAFVQALLGEVNLADALVKGSAAEADFDFSAWLQAALQHAWLQGVRSTPQP
jgi:hypothetical protein